MEIQVSFDSTLGMALAVLLLPLLSFGVSQGIKESYAWLSPIVSSFLLLVAAIISTVLFTQIDPAKASIYQTPWFTVGEKTLLAGIEISMMTVSMAMVVTIISFLVHLFSISYMADDLRVKNYFSQLGFFTFAMIGLVWSNNLLITFCFWELVGYSSYRLIGFWNTKPQAIQAATKSFLINRIADAGFLAGILIVYSLGSLDINSLNSATDSYWMSVAMICIFIGVMGKSAQFPFFTWLPDAMQGPTPVSALIHAATMVAAGVFVLVRLQVVLTPLPLMVMTIVGCITALVGGLGALFQYDIKKILAYSTMSQLGLMILAIGTASFEGGYLHLLNHAFFKAGLFLAAGALIHSFHHRTQDIRKMGGIAGTLRVTLFCILICLSALAALPFTSGFVSKEIILSGVMTNASGSFSWIVAITTIVISLVTVLYSFRLWWYLNATDAKYEYTIPMIMRIPIILLSAASVAVLISFNPIHISGWMDWILNIKSNISLSVTLLSIGIAAIGLVAGYFLYRNRTGRSYPAFLQNDFLYVDKVYEVIVIQPIVWASALTLKGDARILDWTLHQLTYLTTAIAHLTSWFDRFIIDKIFVDGAGWMAKIIGALARSVVMGKVQYYLIWALALFLIFVLSMLYF